MGSEAAVSALIQGLKDVVWQVRRTVASMLLEIGTPEALDAVKKAGF
ncbi:MAG TPA: HEAT repeat domain-containing protein [Flavobacteriales bacterium]|nr:HEAT repeat domain-containing protein [Flavobacteriales bacterium]